MGMIPFHPVRKLTAPAVQQFDLKSDAAFNIGAPVKRHSTANQILEFGGGTDVTGLLGFAVGKAESGLPDDMGLYPYGTQVGVYMADPVTEYVGQLVSGDSTTVLTPAVSNLRTYGIIKATADSNWYIDTSETTSLILTVTQIFPSAKFVTFKLISSVIAV